MKKYDEGGLLGTLLLAMVGIQALNNAQRGQIKNQEQKPQERKQQEPTPVMQVGKIYELMNGKRACCVAQREGVEFISVVIGTGLKLWQDKHGKCFLAEGNVNREKEFNVRRTWKKKYDKQR